MKPLYIYHLFCVIYELYPLNINVFGFIYDILLDPFLFNGFDLVNLSNLLISELGNFHFALKFNHLNKIFQETYHSLRCMCFELCYYYIFNLNFN